MLYDLTWLQEGKQFPPQSELERLKSYEDNRKLFAGKMSEVLRPYRRRVRQITERFAEFDGFTTDTFELDLNYFQLLTLKTGDMVEGEPPTITMTGGEKVELGEAFQKKLLALVYDLSRFGDAVVRLKYDAQGQRDFVIVAPDMWFPIVNREDKDEIICQVIAWIECLNENEPLHRRRYVLNAQVHTQGQFEALTYEVTQPQKQVFFGEDGLNVERRVCKIGRLIKRAVQKTGFDGYAIIDVHNVVTSDSIFGISDYDRITPLVAELQVRYALESLILDKHSCPTPYVPESALKQLKTGEWTFTPGSVVPIGEGEQPPGYMTWDAAFSANHTAIEKLERHLYSLSEMGAVVNDDAFGASQGFEALETRMTNARLKARRISSALTQPLKSLVAALKGVPEAELSVYWNDGLPNNEYREVDIATKKLQGGLFDLETVLQDHFDKSAEDAARIAEKVAKGRSNAMSLFDEAGEDEETEGGR